ncbi:hypothetical protein RSSM_05103 [Rhodopirellula sallentina SM41]|uniref:Uncharacterized protein n=1 Tax=Rhodopirellula sallentina SM41 TaxID=1263870 RepID=M5TWA1_9BACT|nr:hypothetical protein RSSM_05103 [Rhodopirellula sallentina SM41]
MATDESMGYVIVSTERQPVQNTKDAKMRNRRHPNDSPDVLLICSAIRFEDLTSCASRS